MADGQEDRDTNDEDNMEDDEEGVPAAVVIKLMWYCSVCKEEIVEGGRFRKCALKRGTKPCGKTLMRRCDSNNGHCREAHYYGTDMDAHRVAQHPKEWPDLVERVKRKRSPKKSKSRHHKKQKYQWIDIVLEDGEKLKARRELRPDTHGSDVLPPHVAARIAPVGPEFVVVPAVVHPVAPVAVVVRGVAAAPIGSPLLIRDPMNVIDFQSELVTNWTFDTFPFPESFCKVYSLVGGFNDITEGMSVFSFINLFVMLFCIVLFCFCRCWFVDL